MIRKTKLCILYGVSRCQILDHTTSKLSSLKLQSILYAEEFLLTILKQRKQYNSNNQNEMEGASDSTNYSINFKIIHGHLI